MIRIQDLQDGTIDTRGLHKVTPELSNQYRRTLLQGDEIVISLVGTIGLVAIVPNELRGANLHRNLGLIVPGPKVRREYLFSVMASKRFGLLLRQVTKGGNQLLLNLGELGRIEIPVPPMEQQIEFSRTFAAVSHLRLSSISGVQSARELFETLVNRAFRGEF